MADIDVISTLKSNYIGRKYIHIFYHKDKALVKYITDTLLDSQTKKIESQTTKYLINKVLDKVHIGNDTYIVPVVVDVIKTAFMWIASSDDGAFTDESQRTFKSEKECYEDMRKHALEKMKWNTEYNHDFESDDDVISYNVEFSKNSIVHYSYSGIYTYEIKEVVDCN